MTEVRRMTPKSVRAHKLRELEAAAIEYSDASDLQGEDVLVKGARLMVAAKEFTRAARAAGEIP
jgi:hypothetical protein